jgi:hypothetical protein
MAESESWTCPFCNHAAFIRKQDRRIFTGGCNSPFTPSTGYCYFVSAIFCPNDACRKTELQLVLFSTERPAGQTEFAQGLLIEWNAFAFWCEPSLHSLRRRLRFRRRQGRRSFDHNRALKAACIYLGGRRVTLGGDGLRCARRR